MSAMSTRGRNAASVHCLRTTTPSGPRSTWSSQANSEVQWLLGLVVLMETLLETDELILRFRKVWGWVLTAVLGLHGDGSGEGTGFGSGRALFPLPPLHHLLHLHTWPGAAATASTSRRRIPPPQGGACGRLRGCSPLRLQSPSPGRPGGQMQESSLQPPPPGGFSNSGKIVRPRDPSRGCGGGSSCWTTRLAAPVRLAGCCPCPLAGLCHIMKI